VHSLQNIDHSQPEHGSSNTLRINNQQQHKINISHEAIQYSCTSAIQIAIPLASSQLHAPEDLLVEKKLSLPSEQGTGRSAINLLSCVSYTGL
jgi:hypothetical protein